MPTRSLAEGAHWKPRILALLAGLLLILSLLFELGQVPAAEGRCADPPDREGGMAERKDTRVHREEVLRDVVRADDRVGAVGAGPRRDLFHPRH